MIEDIYRIGLSIPKNHSDEIDEDLKPDSVAKLDYVIIINITNDGAGYSFSDIKVAECSGSNSTKFLLKKKAPNGPNYGPTAIITDKKDFNKTYQGKIIGWFKNLMSNTSIGLKVEEAKILTGIYNALKTGENDIIEKYQKIDLDSRSSYLLTVSINGMLPLEDSLIWSCYSLLIRERQQGSHTGTCCLCNKKNVSLLQKCEVFKFYTLDKPGFISGGFDEDRAYRNYPVCLECEIALKSGKDYIKNNLQFSFCGISYYLIPSTTTGVDTLDEILVVFKNMNKEFSFRKEQSADYKISVEDIEYYLKEVSDIFSMRVVFIKQEQSAERILGDTREIFPSRFKELYDARKHVNQDFSSVVKNTGEFNFGFIRTFLMKTDSKMRNPDLDALFLSTAKAVLMKEPVEMRVLLPYFMRPIRQFFLDEEKQYDWYAATLKACMVIGFLVEAGCLNEKGGVMMDCNFPEPLKKYDVGLKNELEHALFLTGAVIKKVMNIQRKEINNTPFKDRLYGLKMRKENVQGIITGAMQKMMEYKKYSNVSKAIFENIYDLLLKTPSEWDLTVDEINFYISAGMTLQKEIYIAFGEKDDQGSVVDEKKEDVDDKNEGGENS